MKKEHAFYARPIHSVVAGKIVWTTKDELVEVMAKARGYTMVRKPRAIPFVVSTKNLREFS